MILKKLLIIIFSVFLFLQALSASEIEKKLQQKISTSFAGTSLEGAMRILAKQYGLNIIVGQGGQERVTATLFDVSLGEALNAILKTHGFHYILGSNVIMVTPFDMAVNGELNSQVFELNYLDGFKLKITLEPILSPKGKIEALLSETEEKDKYIRSNILVVTDMRENIRTIEKIIQQMDKPPKQMQIDVRLVEKNVGDELRVGIDWPKSMKVTMTGAETTAPITQTSQGGGGQPKLFSGWYQLPATSNQLTMGVLTLDELSATLDLLDKDENSKVIANPKVTTLNNKKAIIKIGRTVPIMQISRSVAGDLYSYQPKEVNLQLEVIPQVGLDGYITLKVHPILEEIIGYVGPSEAPYPITAKREVQSTIRLKDSETLVIGGLVKETESKIENKIWLLGDIPLLGYLFTHTSIQKNKTDLIIFITTKLM